MALFTFPRVLALSAILGFSMNASLASAQMTVTGIPLDLHFTKVQQQAALWEKPVAISVTKRAADRIEARSTPCQLLGLNGYLALNMTTDSIVKQVSFVVEPASREQYERLGKMLSEKLQSNDMSAADNGADVKEWMQADVRTELLFADEHLITLTAMKADAAH